jgi:hypothetical protein
MTHDFSKSIFPTALETCLAPSCQFSHISGKTTLGHFLNIWFLKPGLPFFWPTSFTAALCGRISLTHKINFLTLLTQKGKFLSDGRVQEVELLSKGGQQLFRVMCDTFLLTGKCRSRSPLIDNAPIQWDPLNSEPIVDLELMTAVENIFSAENVLRRAQMYDLCPQGFTPIPPKFLDSQSLKRTTDTMVMAIAAMRNDVSVSL